jgi:arginase
LPDQLVPVESPVGAEGRLHRRNLEFLPEIARACDHLAAEVAGSVNNGELALSLGGDHALAIGSVAGAASVANKLGVLWLDAHLDLNTPETSPSGHIHGMALAAALGYGPRKLIGVGGAEVDIDPANICFLGARDIDAGERALIDRHGIWMLTMEEWTDLGVAVGLQRALEALLERGVDAVHVSFDLDVLDPLVMPGTGTRVAGGLTYREASQVVRALRAWDGPVASVDWVELNPSLDPTGVSTEIAVSLLATLLGESIR